MFFPFLFLIALLLFCMLYMNIYRVFVLLFLAICISDPKYWCSGTYGKTAVRKAVWEPSHSYPAFTLGICFTMCTCILQITAWVSYNKIQRLHSYHIGRTRTYRHHVRIRFIFIAPRWKHVCMSLKSKIIFPAGLPNVPVGKHACTRSMLVRRTCKYNHRTFSFQVVGAGCPNLVGRACLFHMFSGNPLTIWWHQHLETSLLFGGLC